MNERQMLLDAVGLALNFMYQDRPELAGVYLDHLVEMDFITAEQGLGLMDVLKKKYAGMPASTNEEAQ